LVPFPWLVGYGGCAPSSKQYPLLVGLLGAHELKTVAGKLPDRVIAPWDGLCCDLTHRPPLRSECRNHEVTEPDHFDADLRQIDVQVPAHPFRRAHTNHACHQPCMSIPIRVTTSGTGIPDGSSSTRAGERFHQIALDSPPFMFHSGTLPDRSSSPRGRTAICLISSSGCGTPKQQRKLTMFEWGLCLLRHRLGHADL
jgi:hypothetical protein